MRLTIWTQALIRISLMSLWQINTNSIICAWTWCTCINLFTMRSSKSSTTLAFISFHWFIWIANAFGRTISCLTTIIRFYCYLQAYTLLSPQIRYHWKWEYVKNFNQRKWIENNEKRGETLSCEKFSYIIDVLNFPNNHIK